MTRVITIPSKVPGFTGVRAIEREVTAQPFTAQALDAPGWRVIGRASTKAAAEAIARGYRTDNRGARTRVTEKRTPGGFAYIAV